MKGLSLDQWCCIYLSTCCWWGNHGLSGGGWTRFFSAMAFPWSMFSIFPIHVFVCCRWVGRIVPSGAWSKSFLTWFHFFGPFSLSLSPIDFIGVEGLALEGRFGKTLSTQTMTLLWAGEVGQDSLGYGLTFGLPLHVFVVCCWGGRVFP